MSDHGASVHQRVAEIIAAAERTAEELRDEAESRVRARIAEGERAAQNRVKAAEDEATDLVKWAKEEAERSRSSAREEAARVVAEAEGQARDIVAQAQAAADRILMEASEAKTAATGEALAIIARAQENADQTLREASDAAVKTRAESDEKARELLRGARETAGAVKGDGMEVVGNLRELGDSLRSNAERLLRDVQAIHSNMLAQIDRVDPERASQLRDNAGGRSRSGTSERARRTPPAAARSVEEPLDVPEFIPPA
jgi:vacuolar-type H+-ATPase subunit H